MLDEKDKPEKGKAILYFGAMIDADKILINGTLIGETEYQYPPRIYRIPEGILHAGENIIEVKLMVFRQEGGFVPKGV